MEYSITDMSGESFYSSEITHGNDWNCDVSSDYNIFLMFNILCSYNFNIHPNTEGATFNIIQNDSLTLYGSYDVWSSNIQLVVINSVDDNSTSEDSIITGCTDISAINYNSLANSEDNSVATIILFL